MKSDTYIEFQKIEARLSAIEAAVASIVEKIDAQAIDRQQLVDLAADVKAHADALKAAIPTT